MASTDIWLLPRGLYRELHSEHPRPGRPFEHHWQNGKGRQDQENGTALI